MVINDAFLERSRAWRNFCQVEQDLDRFRLMQLALFRERLMLSHFWKDEVSSIALNEQEQP